MSRFTDGGGQRGLLSALQHERMKTVPPLPHALQTLHIAPPTFEDVADSIRLHDHHHCLGSLPALVLRTPSPNTEIPADIETSTASTTVGDEASACVGMAPLRVGVVFAGEGRKRPAPPVNVVVGLLDFLTARAPGSTLLGFQDGPEGLLQGLCRELSADEVRDTMSQGGRQLLGYGTCSEGGFTVASRSEEIQRAMEVCTEQRLDGLVVIAGSRDLSWAAVLAVGLKEKGCQTSVLGVPHSKNLNMYVPHFMPVTLGFDSARRMLGEIVGNLCIDALSSKKSWHFVRCGEDALTMEVTLQTRCAFSLLTMEGSHSDVLEERMSMMKVINRLRDIIEQRSATGRRSGVVLVARNLCETLPEMKQLKSEILKYLIDVEKSGKNKHAACHDVEEKLSNETLALFKRLPRLVRQSLLQKRDDAGIPMLPSDVGLESERILGRFVQQDLALSASEFAPRFHNMEIMTNAPLPSPFDCAFGYALGHTVAALVCERRTFYVASCANMHRPVAEWEPCAVPFSFLIPTTDAPLAAACPELGKGNNNDAQIGVRNFPTSLAIPKIGWRVRSNLLEVYRHFREAWVKCNVPKSPGPMQFGDGNDVGPLRERPFSLLAEYLSPNELKQIIQPVSLVELPAPLALDKQTIRDIHVIDNMSSLERKRLEYTPRLPEYLRGQVLAEDEGIAPRCCSSNSDLAAAFPSTHSFNSVGIVPTYEGPLDVSPMAKHSEASFSSDTKAGNQAMRVGVVFADKQVPGYHVVAAGIFDQLTSLDPPAEVIGFPGGYEGLLNRVTVPIDKSMIDQYRNLGGQDLLCQQGSVTNLWHDDLARVTENIAKLRLDGLILLGNIECQVDIALIAEACAEKELTTRVIGVPVSADCDFAFVQQTIGYDTVLRTLSAYIGSIGSEAQSAQTWIFVRMEGSEWSHLAVECTLQVRPQNVLVARRDKQEQSLSDVVNQLCDLITERSKNGQNYGVVLIPFGFIAYVFEIKILFGELMDIFESEHGMSSTWDSLPLIAAKLRKSTAAVFEEMPRDVQYEICFGSRSHRSKKVDLSNVSTERFLLRFVELELERRHHLSLFDASKFRGSSYSMAYQARAAMPTNFDCDLAYTLGYGAALLVGLGKSGQLVHASGLDKDVQEWRLRGIPMISLLDVQHDERRNEHRILAVRNYLLKRKEVVRPRDAIPLPPKRQTVYHGPVQFWGAATLHPSLRITWHMENMMKQDPTELLNDLCGLCGELQSTVAQARQESTLYAVNNLLSNAVSILTAFTQLTKQSERPSDMNTEQGGTVRRIRSASEALRT